MSVYIASESGGFTHCLICDYFSTSLFDEPCHSCRKRKHPLKPTKEIHINNNKYILEKTGQWVVEQIFTDGAYYAVCDQCDLIAAWYEDKEVMGFALSGEKYASYCPNCGARMVGGKK